MHWDTVKMLAFLLFLVSLREDCFLAFSGSSGHLYSLVCIPPSIFRVHHFSLYFCHHPAFYSDPELFYISLIRTIVITSGLPDLPILGSLLNHICKASLRQHSQPLIIRTRTSLGAIIQPTTEAIVFV